MDTSEKDDKVSGAEQKLSSPVVHMRADSDSELQALFDCVLKPTKTMPLQKPFKMRKLPASFFNPPSHRQSPASPSVSHSRESSADSTYGGGGPGPIRVGGAVSPGGAQHFRHHSSPATLQQTFAVAQQQASLHAKQHSFDALAEELGPLPHGWEQAVTSQGQIYFLNHNTQSTTWIDPRRQNTSATATTNTTAPPTIHQTNLNNQLLQQQQQQQQQQNNSNATNNNTSTSNSQQQHPPPSNRVTPASPAGSLSSLPTCSSGSTDQLSIPLPDGWEQSVTEDGEVYFINHIEKITSWHDPRLPRLQNSQILKTQLAHSPLGSPNAQAGPQNMLVAPRSPQTMNRLKGPNSPDARKKLPLSYLQAHTLRRHEDVIWGNPAPSASLLNPNNSSNNSNNNNGQGAPPPPTNNSTNNQQLLMQLQQQQLQQQNQQQLQQQNQQQLQQRASVLIGRANNDPFLSAATNTPQQQTPSEMHTRQESADSGLGLGNVNNNNGVNGAPATNGNAPPTFGAGATNHTTPEDLFAAMEGVEITPSENRRGRTTAAPSIMESNDFESMDSEDLMPTIDTIADELPRNFLTDVIGTNRMDNTWL